MGASSFLAYYYFGELIRSTCLSFGLKAQVEPSWNCVKSRQTLIHRCDLHHSRIVSQCISAVSQSNAFSLCPSAIRKISKISIWAAFTRETRRRRETGQSLSLHASVMDGPLHAYSTIPKPNFSYGFSFFVLPVKTFQFRNIAHPHSMRMFFDRNFFPRLLVFAFSRFACRFFFSCRPLLLITFCGGVRKLLSHPISTLFICVTSDVISTSKKSCTPPPIAEGTSAGTKWQPNANA